MKRLNFYKLNLNKDFLNFKKSILSSTQSNLEEGYINPLEVGEDYLHAIFYKKILINERILNPLGDYESINYYTYQNIEFFIFIKNKIITLAILNQPKSLKNFISFLKKKDSLFFSLGNYLIDIERAIKDRPFKILKAKFIDVELSTNSFATIEINSNNNALTDFQLLDIKGKSELVRVKLIEEYKNILIESEFTNKANFSVKIEHLDYNLIHHLYEKYIIL